VPRAIEKIAATVVPSVAMSFPPACGGPAELLETQCAGNKRPERGEHHDDRRRRRLDTRSEHREGHNEKCADGTGVRRRQEKAAQLLADQRHTDREHQPHQ
jgi:hypothetical protein